MDEDAGLLNIGNMAGRLEPATEAVQKQFKEPTVTERLQDKRDRLAAQIQQTDEALAALKANPEIERVLNLVQRAARY